MTGGSFYLACAINLPGKPLEGVRLAARIATTLETLTGARCNSRWIFNALHHTLEGAGNTPRTLALTDALDVQRSDFVVAAPLTGTSRGVHVELGMAYALGIPVYLYSPAGRDPTAFDSLAHPCPEPWAAAIEQICGLKRRVPVAPLEDPGGTFSAPGPKARHP